MKKAITCASRRTVFCIAALLAISACLGIMAVVLHRPQPAATGLSIRMNDQKIRLFDTPEEALSAAAFSGQTAEEIIASDLKNFSAVPSTYIPGTIHTPKNVYAPVGAGQLRQRFDYASSSTQYNNNVPATKNPTVPVFWNNK